MIKILAEFIIKDNKDSEFIRLAEELVISSRKEQGCIRYEVFKNNDKKNQFIFIEKWEDQKSIEKHNNSAHFTDIVPKLVELSAEEVKINTYKKVI